MTLLSSNFVAIRWVVQRFVSMQAAAATLMSTSAKVRVAKRQIVMDVDGCMGRASGVVAGSKTSIDVVVPPASVPAAGAPHG